MIAGGERPGSVDPQASLHAQVEARPSLTVFTTAFARGQRARLPGSRKNGKEMTMAHAEEMLQTHPTGAVVKSGALADLETPPPTVGSPPSQARP